MISNPRHGSPPRLMAHQPTRCSTTQESAIRVHRPDPVLLARYNAHGPEALGDLRRRNGSAPSVLRPELLARLPERLATPPSDGGLWTGPKVARWMAGELGLAAVLPQRGWEALRAINGSVQKPRPRHPAAATPEECETFKKSWPRSLPRKRQSTRTSRSRSGPRMSTASA